MLLIRTGVTPMYKRTPDSFILILTYATATVVAYIDWLVPG